MLELETIREFGQNAYACVYIGFDKHSPAGVTKETV
jgi:hypothetical protein